MGDQLRESVDEKLSGEALLDALESGQVRAASKVDGDWVTHEWVKRGILDIFATSESVGHSWPLGAVVEGDTAAFRDKDALPVRRFRRADGVRLVPGGSAVRRGAYLASGVVCMPPMYVNVGAWIGPRTMVDSHALIGSCAQVGADVHVSAAAQIGGVLEPPGARPVVIEDRAFVGGGAGVYEGVLVGAGAVLAGGVILSATTPLYDLIEERLVRGTREAPLCVPDNAVVMPGTRPANGAFAQQHGLQQSCALIVKYRDDSTDAATALESALR